MTDEQQKTVYCIHCKHHAQDLKARPDVGPPPGTWFWHYCMHPSVASERHDYVYGKHEIRHPHCRDINDDGHCVLFEEAKK